MEKSKASLEIVFFLSRKYNGITMKHEKQTKNANVKTKNKEDAK